MSGSPTKDSNSSTYASGVSAGSKPPVSTNSGSSVLYDYLKGTLQSGYYQGILNTATK
jgi:hypothetical protein